MKRGVIILVLALVFLSIFLILLLNFLKTPLPVSETLPCLPQNNCDDMNESLLAELKQNKITEGVMLSPGQELVEINDDFNLTDNVLVIYNTNVNDSREIAEYYADKRGISRTRLCPVQLPPGQYATAQELVGARKTIVENCICNAIYESVSEADWPSPCNTSNIDAIARVSPITHIVLIRGIPPRLTGTGWPTDFEEPSFDYYLSILLYRSENLFESGQTGRVSESAFFRGGSKDSERTYVRPINISLDRITAYGRIEAMNKERTLRLIDRTYEAEQNGFSGNFLLGINRACLLGPGGWGCVYGSYSDMLRFLKEISSIDSNPSCTSYVTPYHCGNDTNDWNYTSCRAGFSIWGDIPGESGAKIQRAINAGFYFGMSFDGNEHYAFDGFYNMLHWHKSEYDCIELCKDFQTQQEIDDCRTNSQDYFKEINTDCVGVAPGFLGWQLRSYPVQFYGFWPPGWTNYMDGSYEKSPPVVLEGDSYTDAKFTDNKYLHFGSLDSVDSPNCTLENGTVIDCKERVAPHLFKYIAFNPYISFTGTKTFTAKIRHRNLGTSGASLSVRLLVLPQNGDSYYAGIYQLSLTADTISWETDEFNFTVTDDSKNITGVVFYIISNYINNLPREGIDLDGIELVEEGRNLIDTTTGSFNGSYIGETNPGDYASNAIDRLGAIAWWGSSSHFLTGGWAFVSNVGVHTDFSGAFFSGRSLGESLARTGTSAMSGIIYGDPLYRPSGVRIFLDEDIYHTCQQSEFGCFHEGFGPANATYCNLKVGFKYQDDNSSSAKVYINAFHGQKNLNTTKWQISVCNSIDIYSCDVNNNWTEFESGNHSVFAYKINSTLMTFAQNLREDKDFFVRLRVWNPGEESNDLKSYLYLTYKYIQGSCTDDLDADGIVNCHDNCVYIYNPSQSDMDNDTRGDTCDDDIDGDGLTNSVDMCPLRKGTSGPFFIGCPPPKNWTKFMNNLSTNISILIGTYPYKLYDISFRLGIPDNGTIEFNRNVTIGGIDFDSDVRIERNYVEINTTDAPELNVSANITLFNFSDSEIENITILKDGEICDDCSVLNYTDNTITFNVSHFTVYQVAWCGDGICNAGETCSSCSGDCGTCPPFGGQGTGSGSSGGSSGGACTITSWNCSAWNSCTENSRDRTCVSNCRTNKLETENCTISEDDMNISSEQQDRLTDNKKSESKPITIKILLVSLFLGIILLIAIWVIRRTRK